VHRHHLHRLHTALRLLHANSNASPVSDRVLAEIPQHVGMKQNVAFGLIRYDEAKSLGRIKPLYLAMHDAHVRVFFCHIRAVPQIVPVGQSWRELSCSFKRKYTTIGLVSGRIRLKIKG
jgi:hypothetical protein